MAYRFISDNLLDDLIRIDILSAKGSQYCPHRCNLLLEVVNRWYTEDDLILEIQCFSPEGFGLEGFMADSMVIPIEEKVSGTEKLIWDVQQSMPPFNQKVWVLDLQEVDMIRGRWELGYSYGCCSSWMNAPSPSACPRVLRCLELFAGAYGGWKGALEVLANYQVAYQSVGIEIAERASKAYAISHYANWIGPQVNIPDDWFVTHPENWIWQQDVTNERILAPLTCWQPHVVTISSPCPDWSSAGSAPGLLKPGAKLLFQSVLSCRWLRPLYIALEQVSNFHHHEHKHWIMKALHMVGYKIVWQRVCSLEGQAQTVRLRWLGLARKFTNHLPAFAFTMWPEGTSVWPDVTLQLQEELKKPLFLDSDIIQIASDANMVKTKLAQIPPSSTILSKRIYAPNAVFPTIMAMYGQQHRMNPEYLKRHGYLGHFVQDDSAPYQCRFLHPAEVALLHGSFGKVYLDSNYQEAWHHLGNMIAIPHALLVLGNVCKSMDMVSDLQEVFQGFHSSKLTAANSSIRKMSKGCLLTKHDHLLTQEFCTNVRALEQTFLVDSCQLWSPVHGTFKDVHSFQMKYKQTLVKEFVLRQGRSAGEEARVHTDTIHSMPTMSHEAPVGHNAVPLAFASDALPPAVYRQISPQDECQSSRRVPPWEHQETSAAAATHDPPTPVHATSLPRLGCGDPSRKDEDVRGETIDMDPPIKKLCLAKSGNGALTSSTTIHSAHGASHSIGTDQEGYHQQSPITVASITPTFPDTVIFQPVLKGQIQWQYHQESFWFAADLPSEHIERIWDLGHCCCFVDNYQGNMAILRPLERIDVDDACKSVPTDCIQLLLDEELTLMKVDPDVPLVQHPQLHGLGLELYDQFGKLTNTQKADYGTVILAEPMMHGVNNHDLVYVLAAFSQTWTHWHTCKATNEVIMSVQGSNPSVQFVKQFFSHAISAPSLHQFGRKLQHKDSGDLAFVPSRSKGVISPHALKIAISAAAARMLLDCLESEESENVQMVTIKWAGKQLWQGRIQQHHTIATLESLIRNAFAPLGLTDRLSVICLGRRVPLDYTVGQQPIADGKSDVRLHVVIPLRGGGQGTKMQQRAVQQNAMASTLLDQGFDLAWTTKAVDKVLEKAGLSKLQSVNAMPMGSNKIQAIMTLCKDAGVVLPEPVKPKSGADLPLPLGPKRKKKTSDFQLNPADYSLLDGFFTLENGQSIAQIEQIMPQASGICLQTAAQAKVWISEGVHLSSDELAVLVLGPIQPPNGLETEEITFPCCNCDGNMVLITATLVQLGTKKVLHKQGDPKQVPSEACSLVAVTMYKEDWNEDDWRAITLNPASIVRKQLEKEGLFEGIQAIWGKSLRQHRSPATPHQAMTVQVHLTVEDVKLEKLLARSGFNKLFLTPKTQVGRLNPLFKVIWITGDVPKVTSLSTKCQSCLGLVRGRQGKGYGLRFHTDKYDDAWKILNPGVTPPQNTPGDKVYKLQNLPFGCTKLMLQNWIEAKQWDACPIRALGPQTWLVRSQDEIPPGIPMFNSSPILARLLPPRETQSNDKILLGPRPKQPIANEGDPWQQGQDPWAHYAPQKSAPATAAASMPPQQGPTEKRFLEQDAKIANIQASLEQMQQAQTLHAKQVESQFKQAAQREQDNLNKVDQAIKHLEQSVDSAMTKSVHQYQAAMDEKFQELKHLFMSQKRSAPPEDADMKE